MDSVLEPLIKSFLAQMDSAMKVSELISQHDGSEEITVDHLITGLVYRLMVPMTNEEVDTALETAQEIMDKLDETDSEEESMAGACASEAEEAEGEAPPQQERQDAAHEEAKPAVSFKQGRGHAHGLRAAEGHARLHRPEDEPGSLALPLQEGGSAQERSVLDQPRAAEAGAAHRQ